MTFQIKQIVPELSHVQLDAPNINLRRVLRIWRRGESQLRPISEIVVRLRLSMLRVNDLSVLRDTHDALDEILYRFYRRQTLREQHNRNDIRDMVVVLRLSLMQTIWEKMGFLDLPYIDSVIRQTIKDFRNKHKTNIKPEHWGILAEMCWNSVNHARRIEPEQESDPADIDIDDDDISAWINSELDNGTET